MKRDQQRAAQNMRPVLWLRDGEEKTVRFRDDEMIAFIHVHEVKEGSKFKAYTCRGRGCPLCTAGIKKSGKAIWEVIDYAGYVTKQGKKVQNVARFFEATGKRNAQIEKIAEKQGLTSRDVDISREGNGTSTVYTFIASDPKPLLAAIARTPRLKNEFDKWYAPPPIEEAKEIALRHSGADVEADNAS